MEIPNSLIISIKLQDYLENINKNNYKDLLNFIENEYIIKNEEMIYELCYIISQFSSYRPLLIEEFTNLIFEIIKKNFIPNFSIFFLNIGLKYSPLIIKNLFDKGIYTENIFKSFVSSKYLEKFNFLFLTENKFFLKNGWSENSIEYLIKFDLVEKFKESFFSKKIDNSYEIEWSEYELFYIKLPISLIGLTCYYGSVKCFNFLKIGRAHV